MNIIYSLIACNGYVLCEWTDQEGDFVSIAYRLIKKLSLTAGNWNYILTNRGLECTALWGAVLWIKAECSLSFSLLPPLSHDESHQTYHLTLCIIGHSQKKRTQFSCGEVYSFYVLIDGDIIYLALATTAMGTVDIMKLLFLYLSFHAKVPRIIVVRMASLTMSTS